MNHYDEYLRALAELNSVKKERDMYLVNLTSTQARCTELLAELRHLKEELRKQNL